MNTKDQQWALFWCSVLHRLIFEEIAPEQRARHLKQLSEQEWRFPDGTYKKASLSTLKRKWKCYQQGGLDALVRKRRGDRGQARKLSPEIIDKAVEIKRDLPTRSARTINQFLQHQYQLTIPRSTLYRQLKQQGATRLKLGVAKTKVRCRWTRERANELWVGDFSNGPYVMVDAQVQATYLSLFIDCHSRYVVEGRYYLRQSMDILVDSLLRAWTRHGTSHELYLDNAKVYHANALKAACYGLHIHLLHRRPRDPSPGGLVERLFLTNQQQFEAEVRAGHILTLDRLNKAFRAWLGVVYHQTMHCELHDTPQNRFEQGIRRPLDLEQAIRFFMQQKKRIVHRDFSDVAIDGCFYRLERRYRGDSVLVRYDPFSTREKVWIYSEDDTFLCTAERYHREIQEHFQPQPLPKPKYNYLDMIIEQQDKALDAQAQGIDFTKLTRGRWPFSSFVHTLAQLLGEKAGISAFSTEQLETLKAAYHSMPSLCEAQLVAAAESAEVKNLHHILWQLQQQREQ
jgi:putative transposase